MNCQQESGVCVTNNVDPPGEDMEAGQLDMCVSTMV